MLPVLARRAEIEETIRAHRVVVLTGETGSGKTTQLPQIVWGMRKASPPSGPLSPGGGVAHTQPRRLAARAVSARIAEEMGVRLGGLVGYKVRFDERTSRETGITVMTDGMLLAEIAQDPDLSAYSTVILDEAHERSLNIDILLGYMKGLLQRRGDLKLIITSATIEPGRFSDFFGGRAVAPVIEVSGRTFPVEVRYRAVRLHEDEDPDVDVGAVVSAVEEITGPRGQDGDVLVFLPGEREIRRAAEALKQARVEADVLPLFSKLSNAEQDRIFHWSPGMRTRVVLATNVAETSLTVPGIRHVVDCGLERRNFYDPARKVQTLPVVPVSRASADQRKGRCGRVAAGVCIRLYSEASYRARPAFTEPEVRRTSLASVILQVASMGLPTLDQFPLLDPPDPAAIREGYDTLFELGAMQGAPGSYRITEVGRRMARLPVDPRIARMIIAAEAEGCVEEVLTLAAVLSIQDPRERPMERQQAADSAHAVFRDESSDFMTLLNLWDQYRHAGEELTSGPLQGWCRDHFVNAIRMREWGETRRQLRDIIDEDFQSPKRERGEPTKASNPAPTLQPDRIHRALLTGLITNLACRDGEGGSFDYRGVKGNVVSLFPGSVLFKKGPKWIMAAEIVRTTKLYARTAAKVEPEWIEELASHVLERQVSDPHLDADTGEPSAWERLSMNGVVVVPRRRVPIAATDPARARTLFIRDALVLGKWKGAGGYIGRVRAVLDSARTIEAKLRRRNVVKPEPDMVAWFEAALPPTVVDPGTLAEWRSGDACAENPGLGLPALSDFLSPEAAAVADLGAFPDALTLAGADEPVRLSYVMSSGADDDGLTATLGLADLPALTPERAAWLVPGLLPDVVLALLKTLPKAVRASVEAKGELESLAASAAGVMNFAVGPLGPALSEVLEVLHGVTVDPGLWAFKALPTHLKLRVRATGADGQEVAADRDLLALLERLAVRVKKARAGRARSRFEREGITAWDFGELPDSVDVEAQGEAPAGSTMFPALVDRGESCALTLVESQTEAAARTVLGVRRLFALACREQIAHELAALPAWRDMTKHYGALGTPDQLRDELTCLIAERAFLAGQPLPRAAEEFEARQQAGWGRLSQVVRDVADTVARVLEPRFLVASRLNRGTSRHWAASVADIREHAAYLMPRGFLLSLPWERLREYPRYAEGMRQRLFALREDGSGAEKQLLEQFLPHWKRFTAWVAAAMSAERAAADPDAPAKPGASKRAPLPQARRAAPTVNVDAGDWAMAPGRLPPAVTDFRWALEELRLAMFAPDLAAKPAMSAARVEALAKQLPRA